jgi:hypothetical protein
MKMKNHIVFSIIIIMLFVVMGAVNQSTLETTQSNWVSVGTFLATGAEPSTPNQANRTAALMAAVSKVQIFTIPPAWNKIYLRNSSTTDGDSTVYDVFLSRGAADHYTRVCTLTYTTGTQTAGTTGYEFADTCAVTNNTNTLHIASTLVTPTGNYIAEYGLTVCGNSRVAFVPTTITNDALLEICGSYE